jgi:hypothetical protein
MTTDLVSTIVKNPNKVNQVFSCEIKINECPEILLSGYSQIQSILRWYDTVNKNGPHCAARNGGWFVGMISGRGGSLLVGGL